VRDEEEDEEPEKTVKPKRGEKREEKKGPIVANNLGPRTKNERGDYVVTTINIADRQSKKEGQQVT
jgi:hypothetical protein